MDSVPIRQLNQDTAGVLARAKKGAAVDITERGVVIARLVPSRPHPLAELIAAGWEPESAALAEWLTGREAELVSPTISACSRRWRAAACRWLTQAVISDVCPPARTVCERA
ncbi:MAG: type II toxin-antitoxin system Phd/YefM family antitoxin [Dermatophilaceae bacterium]